MKRRRFLSLIGAAATAPLAPALPQAAPLYSRTMFSRAVMHARLRPHVSARGIAYRLKVSTTQAEGMIAEMATKGMVKPVLNGGGVHVRAISSIVKPQLYGVPEAARRTQMSQAAKAQARLTGDAGPTGVNLSAMLTHLRGICRDAGHTIHPRAWQPEVLFA